MRFLMSRSWPRRLRDSSALLFMPNLLFLPPFKYRVNCALLKTYYLDCYCFAVAMTIFNIQSTLYSIFNCCGENSCLFSKGIMGKAHVMWDKFELLTVFWNVITHDLLLTNSLSFFESNESVVSTVDCLVSQAHSSLFDESNNLVSWA